MDSTRSYPAALIPLVLAMACFALPAFAYFDPGTGSLLLQMILGGVAGIAVVVKLYWHKLLALFGKKPKDDGAEPRPEA
ncbi:MAG: hypothetical protein AAGD06_00850 [Acidobacteriota bacterium]